MCVCDKRVITSFNYFCSFSLTPCLLGNTGGEVEVGSGDLEGRTGKL